MSIPLPRRHQPTRHASFGLLALAALLTLLALAGPAAAAQPCGRQVIDDWYDDGRVDGTYPLHCYDDAIEILPRDVRDYSSAKDDIRIAMTAAMRNEGSPPATNDPSPEEPARTPGDDPPTSTPKPETGPDSDPKDEVDHPEAGPTLDPDESASSIPIPLLILAGLALLLVAGGSGGYLVRRLKGRNVPPPSV